MIVFEESTLRAHFTAEERRGVRGFASLLFYFKFRLNPFIEVTRINYYIPTHSHVNGAFDLSEHDV
jgi:hypothetical protein